MKLPLWNLAHNDTITDLLGTQSIVVGGSGADNITVATAFNQVDAGADGDIIRLNGGDSLVDAGDGNDTIIDNTGGTVEIAGGIGNDTFVHNNDGVTFITDVGGDSDSLIFNVADVGTLQFFQAGNDLIIADALDTNFENFVDVVGFFICPIRTRSNMCSTSTATASRSAKAYSMQRKWRRRKPPAPFLLNVDCYYQPVSASSWVRFSRVRALVS